MATKDIRTRLRHLAGSVLDRDQSHAAAKRTAQKIMALLEGEKEIFFEFDDTQSEIFARFVADEQRISARQILSVLEQLYVKTLQNLHDQLATPSDLIIKYRLPKDLAVPMGNRPMRQLAATLEAAADKLRVAHDAKIREGGQALWFVASALTHLTPPMQRVRAKECAFCHRHTENMSVCSRHRVGGKYQAPPEQRERYLAQLRKRITATRKAPAKAVHDLSVIDAASPKSTQALVGLARQVLSEQSAQILGALASQKPAAGEPSGVQALAARWYTHPDVDDPVGLTGYGDASLPQPLHLLADIVRYDAFMAIGGDLPRARRNAVEVKEDAPEMVKLKRSGKSVTQIAATVDATYQQVRRVLQADDVKKPEDVAKPKTAKASAAKTGAAKKASTAAVTGKKSVARPAPAPAGVDTPAKRPGKMPGAKKPATRSASKTPAATKPAAAKKTAPAANLPKTPRGLKMTPPPAGRRRAQDAMR